MYCSNCGKETNHGAGNCPEKNVMSTPPATAMNPQVIELMAEIERLKANSACPVCTARRKTDAERQRRHRNNL